MVVQQLVTLLQAQANADNGGSVSGNSENHNTGDSNSGAGSGGGVGGQGIQLPHQLQQLLLNQVTAVVDAPAGGQTSGGSGGSPAVPVTGGSAAGLAQSLFSAFNGHQGGQQALPQQSETH